MFDPGLMHVHWVAQIWCWCVLRACGVLVRGGIRVLGGGLFACARASFACACASLSVDVLSRRTKLTLEKCELRGLAHTFRPARPFPPLASRPQRRRVHGRQGRGPYPPQSANESARETSVRAPLPDKKVLEHTSRQSHHGWLFRTHSIPSVPAQLPRTGPCCGYVAGRPAGIRDVNTMLHGIKDLRFPVAAARYVALGTSGRPCLSKVTLFRRASCC